MVLNILMVLQINYFLGIYALVHPTHSSPAELELRFSDVTPNPHSYLQAAIGVKSSFHKTELQAKLVKLKGQFTNIGGIKYAEGILHKLAGECSIDDNLEVPRRLYAQWLAVLYYGSTEYSEVANSSDCMNVLDRIKQAMMFGASAIVILTLNPKIIAELDISELFSKPVLLITHASNISTIIDLLSSNLRIHARLQTDGSVYNVKKVTMWSICGRSTPGEGVVCNGGSTHIEKVNPTSFWEYFFSFLAMLIILLLVKSGRPDDLRDINNAQKLLQHQVIKVLSTLPTKRYQSCRSSSPDSCAICLDDFQCKQKVRVLPCLHEFHTRCVDPWLIKWRTCPLCKMNIMGE